MYMLYCIQLEQRIEQHKMTQISLDEKRSELLSTETQLKSTEEKYYNSTVNLQDKVVSDLRVSHKLSLCNLTTHAFFSCLCVCINFYLHTCSINSFLLLRHS